MWKRRRSGKPQQSAAAVQGESLVERSERQTAADGSTWQHLLAPYKQEVARSSRAPPILATRVRSGTSAIGNE